MPTAGRPRRHRLGVVDLGQLPRHFVGGEHEPGVVVVDGRAEHHAEHLPAPIDQRTARIALSDSPLTVYTSRVTVALR
jgi:hypothetical protein